MITISKTNPLALAAAALALGASAFGASAGETASMHVLKPMQGVSLDMGTKKVAAYYLANDKTCDLTVTIADLPDADGNVSGGSTRITMPVAVGSKARVYTAEGRALEASCSLAANIVTLRPLAFTATVVQ